MDIIIQNKKANLIETLKKDVNDKLIELVDNIQNGKEISSNLSWRINPILYKFSSEWECLTFADNLLKNM